ncbi:MAG: fibronectin type III domain-containing protein, partial [Lachnospiraceae bacterium]|nr:fibronectin type III domain-containing protein [Lachnospiraceae bacterium]
NSKKKAIALKWKKISGAKGYEIQYSTKKNFKKNSKTKTTKKVKYTIKSLKKKKTYYVRVRAYKTDVAGKKVYGKWSKVKKVKVKK